MDYDDDDDVYDDDDGMSDMEKVNKSVNQSIERRASNSSSSVIAGFTLSPIGLT